MTLAQMKYFCEVYKTGNMTQASEALHISQPSISASIRELENEFGIKLFYRRKNRLIPTKEGEIFYNKINGLLEDIIHVTNQMKVIGNSTEKIKIGVSPMLSMIIFSPLYNKIRREHPDLDIEMYEYGSLDTEDLITKEQLDLGIVILNETAENRFHIMPLKTLQLVYGVDRSHPLAGREKVSLQDLKDEKIVVMRSTSYSLGKLVLDAFDKEGVVPNVQLHSSQLLLIEQNIREGNAGAFLLEDILPMMQETVGIPIDPPIWVKTGVIWKKGTYLNSSVSNVLEFIGNNISLL